MIKIVFFLSRRKGGMEKKKDLSSLGSLPEWLQWPGLGQIEAKNHVYHKGTGAQVPGQPSSVLLGTLTGN